VIFREQSLMERQPDRTQSLIAIGLGFLWLAGGVFCRLFGETPLPEFPVFMVDVDAMLIVSDLVIATLLFAQARVYRSVALLVLAGGYLFSALMAIPHALTFPGAYTSVGLLGAGLSSTAWLAIFWRSGFSLAIAGYAIIRWNQSLRVRQPALEFGASVGTAIAAAIVLSMLATSGTGWLPSLVASPRLWYQPDVVPVVGTSIALCLAAMVTLMTGKKSRLDVWLLVSMVPWLVHLLLIMSTSGRFTVSWYFAQGAGLVSHVIVMLALIAKASGTGAQRALSLVARDRERDAQLMSLDAVAAAISHEVGQPLAAIVTNAGAGLRWLGHVPPNLEMVSRSLQSNVEEGHRASAIMRSVRTVLAKRSGDLTTFNLNALVRETVPLLDRKLTRAKILLQLALDETLPPISADRLQIQQVLINLLTNGIQSLGETQGRSRRMIIRTKRTDNRYVLLEVGDNGVGIAPDKMAHIFDAFFTTKPEGLGMGLSLCRTIVERHSGRLWASQGAEHGTTFHLQMRSEPLA
jgi:signal transduction histidine kinase